MAKTIKEQMDELDKLTEWFYSDEFNPDEAQKKYAEAVKMQKEIVKQLDVLENEIKEVKKDFTKDEH